ncbi:MAG TPA: ribosome small subunit-dependent GTPase A [Drouetiella sp.]
MASGTVLRSHAGGYLVHESELDLVLLCAARGRLKKERASIVTGDHVELDEVNPEQKTAVITTTLKRENLLSRPPLANVDQVIIVQAVHQPEWNPLLTDRYIVHFQLELAPVLPVLCFNKCDLADETELLALRSIYEPLGYFVIFVSAVTGQGIQDLAKCLSDKVSVFAGQSGVGKSTLLNCIESGLRLRTGVMENEYGVGRHTTTASELYRLSFEQFPEVRSSQTASWVGDTPGFNLLELRHPQPAEVVWQFPEILELAHDCKFLNCLHLVETGCNVLEHLSEISEGRYNSYAAIVSDAQSEYGRRLVTSQKTEANVKSVGGKEGKATQVPRLSTKYRVVSRRREKQGQHEEIDTDDEDLETSEDELFGFASDD